MADEVFRFHVGFGGFTAGFTAGFTPSLSVAPSFGRGRSGRSQQPGSVSVLTGALRSGVVYGEVVRKAQQRGCQCVR